MRSCISSASSVNKSDTCTDELNTNHDRHLERSPTDFMPETFHDVAMMLSIMALLCETVI